jgi:hypothetical protein
MSTDRALEIAERMNRERAEVEAAETLRSQPLFDRELDLASRARGMTFQQIVSEWRAWMGEGIISFDGFIYRVAMGLGVEIKARAPEQEDAYAAALTEVCARVGAPEVADAWRLQPEQFKEMELLHRAGANGSFSFIQSDEGRKEGDERGQPEAPSMQITFTLPSLPVSVENTRILNPPKDAGLD